MYVELHILQNFAPNCLNRDDTNSPKDCVFGGYRRARISSQCIKRAIRTHVRDAGTLEPDDLARRSKRMVRETAKRLAQQHDRDEAESLAKSAAALKSQGLTADDSHETEYLLFLGEREIDALADVVNEYWDAIEAKVQQPDDSDKPVKKRSKKSDAPKEVSRAVRDLLDGGKAADLAMYGRMLADLPDRNIDAASQVAHAISTNAIAMEMDFFTAVDDLKDRMQEGEDAGAGMLGTVEYNSACYYRYANIHVPQLVRNLGCDADLAERTVRAFLEAGVRAVPTGKQNSFAAHNPPSLIFAVVRNDSPWSLTNAFVKPVEPRYEREDLVAASVRRLDHYWHKLCAVYGDDAVVAKAVVLLHDSLTDHDDDPAPDKSDHMPLKHLNGDRKETLAELIDETVSSIDFDDVAETCREDD